MDELVVKKLALRTVPELVKETMRLHKEAEKVCTEASGFGVLVQNHQVLQADVAAVRIRLQDGCHPSIVI